LLLGRPPFVLGLTCDARDGLLTGFQLQFGTQFHAGAAFVDYDRDGRLDLYVGGYATADAANFSFFHPPTPGGLSLCAGASGSSARLQSGGSAEQLSAEGIPRQSQGALQQ
jgi:hypothetical protein